MIHVEAHLLLSKMKACWPSRDRGHAPSSRGKIMTIPKCLQDLCDIALRDRYMLRGRDQLSI